MLFAITTSSRNERDRRDGERNCKMGKNASDIGSTILNKTVEVGKKIIGGAATVLGNVSGEMKKP